MTDYYLVVIYKNQKFSDERKMGRLRFVNKNYDLTYSMKNAKKFTLQKARKIRDSEDNSITQHFRFIIVNDELKMVR